MKKEGDDAPSDLAMLGMGALEIIHTVPAAEQAQMTAEVGAPSPTTVNWKDGYLLPTEIRHPPDLTIATRLDGLAPIQKHSLQSDKSNGGITLPPIAALTLQLPDDMIATTTKHAHNMHRPSNSSISPLLQAPHQLHDDNLRRGLLQDRRTVTAAYPRNNSRKPSPATTPSDYSGAPNGHTPAESPARIDCMSIEGITSRQFPCSYPGCSVQPFQAQYLLSSHAHVHSSDRPHYCSVKTCPRGEKGKGFKRKNEMIRHGLVHEPPGYNCPYCQRKYPRPDNLRR